MANTVNEINLLPNKGESLLTQFLSWTLSVGRLLIILTETLALGTFLYRFSLDMRIVDLNDQIKAENFIVKNFTAEASFRNLQNRISLAKTYDASREETPKIFSDIIEMGRNKVTFRTLTLSDGSVKLDVQAPSANALSSFVNNLKAYPAITTITIDTVENKTSSATVLVRITAMLHTTSQPVDITVQTQ